MVIYKHLKTFFSIFLVIGFTTSAIAGDISGTWVGKIDETDIKIIIKADGSTLTGKVVLNDMFGTPFEDGKIEGDKISFNIKIGGSLRRELHRTVPWDGTIEGDKMHVTTSFIGGKTREFIAKKISSVRELNAKVVDGLGRPLKDAVIKVQWYDNSNKDDIRTVDLLTLISDEKGDVKGTYDESVYLAGFIMFNVEKSGYRGYSSSGWKSEFVLKHEFNKSAVTRIAEMEGDARTASMRDLLSGDTGGLGHGLDVQIFELEHKLRAPLRELVTDQKIGIKAGMILSFIGVPEETVLYI